MEAIHLSIHSKTTVLCVCISCLFLGLQIWRSTNGPPTSSKITKQPGPDQEKGHKICFAFWINPHCWNTINLDNSGERSNRITYRVFMFRSSVFSLTLQARFQVLEVFRNFFFLPALQKVLNFCSCVYFTRLDFFSFVVRQPWVCLHSHSLSHIKQRKNWKMGLKKKWVWARPSKSQPLTAYTLECPRALVWWCTHCVSEMIKSRI